MCFWATYICVGEARDEDKGDDSGCGRPPAVVAPPSPPQATLPGTRSADLCRYKAPSCRDKGADKATSKKITAYSRDARGTVRSPNFPNGMNPDRT